ncbi:hypothetical protein B0H14DRAFT_3170155 [Mycena olivaceomarginata]|nr:hypothetical protein B0H14DRAFT_3170155 [Mycena olivaceomarginata]
MSRSESRTASASRKYFRCSMAPHDLCVATTAVIAALRAYTCTRLCSMRRTAPAPADISHVSTARQPVQAAPTCTTLPSRKRLLRRHIPAAHATRALRVATDPVFRVGTSTHTRADCARLGCGGSLAPCILPSSHPPDSHAAARFTPTPLPTTTYLHAVRPQCSPSICTVKRLSLPVLLACPGIRNKYASCLDTGGDRNPGQMMVLLSPTDLRRLGLVCRYFRERQLYVLDPRSLNLQSSAVEILSAQASHYSELVDPEFGKYLGLSRRNLSYYWPPSTTFGRGGRLHNIQMLEDNWWLRKKIRQSWESRGEALHPVFKQAILPFG